MRRSLLGFTALATVLLLGACEGPAGPPGPAGPQGDAGPQGPAGQDANETCTDCHRDDTYIVARQVQYMVSQHATGSTFERNDTECAVCHTHEGFVERIATGEQETAAVVSNPTPVNCRTCHQVHTTYTSGDMALTTEAAVTLWLTGDEVDIGEGNLCANCHQPRPTTIPDPTSTDPFAVTSPFWGPHHGPQSALIVASGPVEFAGSMTYPATNPHAAAEDGCVTCHMAEPYGNQAGGHTLWMEYQYHGSDELLTAGCEACHTADEAVTNFEDIETEVKDLLSQLSAKLQAAGILDATDNAVPGSWSQASAAALWNYLFILEDRSNGVHNPEYAVALLTNTLEQDLPPAIMLTAPDAGAAIAPGSTFDITWDASDDMGPVTVDLSYTADGVTETSIATGLSGGTYSWAVPAGNLYGMQIKAVATDNASQTAEDAVSTAVVVASERGYVSAATCGDCHTTQYTDVFASGHPYKLNKVEGAPPTYPASTSPGVPDVPAILASWNDVTYVIGGYGWKARFIGTDGYIVTGNAGDGVQYNLPLTRVGTSATWVEYHPGEQKPYDCGSCHTTGWQSLAENGGVHQDGLEGIHGTWEEPGITCEQCHGAGLDHVVSLAAADITVDNSTALCGTCHVRGDPATIPASGGYIRHHEQYNELLASPHTGGTMDVGCNDCHDPHKGTLYGHADAGGIVATCESCHPDEAATNAHIAVPDCVDCHMARATKSGQALNTYTGDVRSHLFKINPDSTLTKSDMFNADGSLADKGYLTLDVVCYTCHQDGSGEGGSHSAKTMGELSLKATGIHTP